jgi:hypothetical protein
VSDDIDVKAREFVEAATRLVIYDLSEDAKGGLARSIASLVRETIVFEREAAAAYCLDRADQYETKSPIWVGLADASEGIAKGEAAEWLKVGETEDLLERVRKLADFKRATPKPKTRALNRTPLTRDKIG